MKQNSGLSRESAQALLNRPEGQKLAALLKAADPRLAEQAARALASGDPAAAARVLAPLLQDGQVQALLAALQEDRHG